MVQASERNDKQRQELEQVMRFMTRNRCAPYLIDKVRHWLYYTFSPKTEEVERTAILQSLPRAMVGSFSVRVTVLLAHATVFTRFPTRRGSIRAERPALVQVACEQSALLTKAERAL